MDQIAAISALAGASIFLLLGIAHAVFALQSSPTGGPLMPTDPSVREAMGTVGGLGMARDIESSLYRAWIGFNFSHALGVVAIGAIVAAQVATDFSSAVTEPWFLVLTFIAPAAYFVLAVRYWFDKPRDGIALGTLLLWAGVIIEVF